MLQGLLPDLGKLRAYARGFAVSVFLAVFALPAASVQAAEDADLMERWLVHDPLSARTVNHTIWGDLLETYLVTGQDGRNRFNFAAITEEDRGKLDLYLARLSRSDVDRLNRQEQMVFWINAFNALLVREILREYPVDSIRKVGGSLFSPGPWKEKIFRVYSIELSLNDIYHRILRPIWQDVRLHYALACGAKSCPQLAGKPYTRENTENLLVRQTGKYINKIAVLRILGNAVRLTSIYHWYGEDFGESDAAVLSHLREYADEKLKARLEGVTNLSGHGFDWSLDEPSGH